MHDRGSLECLLKAEVAIAHGIGKRARGSSFGQAIARRPDFRHGQTDRRCIELVGARHEAAHVVAILQEPPWTQIPGIRTVAA